MMELYRTDKENKAFVLAEIEGYGDPYDLLDAVAMDSVVPGICGNPDCDYSTGVEPDQNKGWCENCNTGSVISILYLMDIV